MRPEGDKCEVRLGEFEAESVTNHTRRYKTMEGAANKLQKEAKGYLDSLRGRNEMISAGS